MASTAKIIAACLILSVSMQMCCGSAIPIWEFLTRNEKMSYLYSTFAQLVSVHCKATAVASSVPVNQCKRNLLTYGNEKLQTFSEAQLDALDPYQHGANDLIWSAIMRDHPSSVLITTRKPLPTPPASSIIILTHQTPAAEIPKNSPSVAPGDATPEFPRNPIFEANAEPTRNFAMDMDIAYGLPSMTLQPPPAQVETFEISPQGEILPPVQELLPPKTFLTGPMVFRLRPDGTPVQGDDYAPLPRDDDMIEVYQMSGDSSSTESQDNGDGKSNTARPYKHRKIATISALKQQQLELTSALQRELQPPFEQPRIRRQFQSLSRPMAMTGAYFYNDGQA